MYNILLTVAYELHGLRFAQCTLLTLHTEYAFLDDSTKTTDLKEWGKFIAVLYDDILNDKFPKTSTAFEIPLSQVQKYKLQKKGISKNFLTDL